ncbi:MAG: TolC family protein, partial [Candidatus Caldatribacteriaceae bacterium]
IEVAGEKYDLRQKQYGAGAIDAETLLESELTLLQAQNDYRKNVYELILKWLDVQRSAGKSIAVEELFSGSKEVVE